MPVTPFHFGPGLLLKAGAPRHVSFIAFVASQIVIDVESGYYLLKGVWPVHRVLHTLPVATLAGIATGALVWGAARALRQELGARPALVGGLLGGVTHPIFDAIMHSDVQPFWPLSTHNPLLDLIGLGALHLACVLTFAVGAMVLWLRS